MKKELRSNPIYVAQDILSRRDHSEAEVRKKLQHKGFTSADIQKAIDWLYTKKLLDDQRYMETYVTSVINRKAVGPMYLIAKLRERGIAGDVAKAFVRDHVSRDQEKELLQQAAESWMRTHQKHADDKVRLMRHLASRGFPGYLIEDYLS